MKLGSKPGLAAGLAVLALAAPASAAPVTVNLRIEGATATHFEGQVTTDTRATIDGGSGPHLCDGTNNGGPGPGPTVGAALATASEQAPFPFTATWFDSAEEYFLDSVRGERPDFNATQTFWALWLDGQAASTGMCEAVLQPGAQVVWAVATGSEHVLALSGPSAARRGDSVTLNVTDSTTGDAVPDASVGSATTDQSGRVTIPLTDTGTKLFKATKGGQIRSNALSITVVAPGQPLPPPPAGGIGAAPDRLAPLARLLGIADHQTFAKGRGPRTLKASVTDASGVAAVKLRLTRRSGGRCSYFSGRRQELERTRCGRAFFFKAGDGPDVSYLLPERLPRGRYVLDLAAVDRAGNRSALARGGTRVVFTVR